MLKVRLSGTKNELRRFVKNMSRSRQYDLETISDFMRCDNEKYHRIYLGVYPVKKTKNVVQRIS